MTSTSTADKPRITRDDIEAKLTQIQGGAAAEVEARTRGLLAAGLAAVVVGLLLAYLLGRRRGRKRRTVVEIRRI